MSQYSTVTEGLTAAVTQGDATVVIAGATLLTSAAAGELFTKDGSGVPYFVGSITNNTTLELTGNYAGITEAAVNFTIQTSETTNLRLPYMEQGDHETATIFKAAMFILDRTQGGSPETPSGVMDGANATFTLAHTPSGPVRVYHNGQRLSLSVGSPSIGGYTISGAVITMLGVHIPIDGDELIVDYAYI